jgi:putative hydroxymethylpyrimidine transport system substrate-binding protein
VTEALDVAVLPHRERQIRNDGRTEEVPVDPKKRNIRSRLLAIGVVMGVLLAACGSDAETPAASPSAGEGSTGAESPAPEPATLKVALDWFPNPDHVALYYAQDNGFYDDQNLTVEFETPSDVTAGLKLVATNKFDLSIFYQGDMFFAAQESLPVIAVGSLVPQPLNSLMALADSKVQGPDSVKGATIGVAGLPFDDAILETIRTSQGLSESDVTSVNVGFDLVPALLSKQVDAAIGTYFNIEGIHIESETGEAPVIVKMEELGVPTYDELIVVANTERLQSDPEYADAVSRFLTALTGATTAAQADEAGSLATMEANTEYTKEEIAAMVPDTLPLLTSPQGLETGCFNLDAWQTFGDWMFDNGLLETAIDPATIATNDYLPAC